MLFHSLTFVLFFLFVFLVYVRLGVKAQNFLLLFAGLAFYASWGWVATAILCASVVANYFGGLWIHRVSESRRNLFTGFLIVANIVLLGAFKYTGFGAEIWNDIVGVFDPEQKVSIPKILLPLGISFYTFHNISYIIEVRYEKVLATENFIEFAVYDLFFPLLLLGPIERPNALLPQIAKPRRIDAATVWEGGCLFCWGIFKKVFVGDNLQFFIEKSLQPGMILPDGIAWWIGISLGIQLYADFSGYSDAARGLARMMGFRLTLNFDFPYIAPNPSEFWKRWHISLSTWLRDYIYIPLGGNRIGLLRQISNLMIVWILGGLWHGATYGYLTWGLYCGIQVVCFVLLQKAFSKLDVSIPRFIYIILQYLGAFLTWELFSFGLILFRFNSPFELGHLIENASKGFYFSIPFLLKFFFFVSPLFLMDILQLAAGGQDSFFIKWRSLPKFASYSPLVLGLVFLFFLAGIFEKKVFVYFQF
ncbi:acyltransferase [Leptospira perolatii]|uniref:Acyltransferase n=1 Tax=Leptospira perolatii TaxID=2023191 RepID=A0A2M9ZN68_9LEPT|nr:MBOAT family O-acyltransferase [Leptospira perolatii]PJZ68692.1 acyltransferase [Leptospira perolatii]PJZ73528.1 acyltransferase [Leptospira perolatii]